MTEIIRFDKYERHGAYHWALYAKGGLYRDYVDSLCEWVQGQPLLDVGAGDGLIAFKLGAQGIEFEPVGVALAASKGANVVQGDACALPFEDATFNAVLFGDSIEHIQDPTAAIQEARRVLRDGGSLYVTTPPAAEKPRPYHYREYTEATLRELVEPIGFRLAAQMFVRFERIHAVFEATC